MGILPEMKNEHTYQKLIKWEPYFHGLLWCMVLFYPYVKYMGREGGYPMSFLHELNSLFFKMTISYFLYLWIFPKENKVKYLLIAVFAFALNVVGYALGDSFFHYGQQNFWLGALSSTLTYLGFGVLFFTLFTFKQGYKKQLQINQLTQEKQQAEIRMLKAQVNPHFLFNTLNTIYANALKNDDKTPELILKLSDGFRYMLHEGQKEYVTIQQEVQHLRDYIDLQKERLGKKVNVNFTAGITDETQQIAPLLCIGFIENSFKYTSILKGEKHNIVIELIQKDKGFSLFCSNPCTTADVELDENWKKSGIGIKNIKERLALLYPEKHNLSVIKGDAVFEIKLNIEL
jgi:sensor histidine kinase YesM